jgi:hypothetical protein
MGKLTETSVDYKSICMKIMWDCGQVDFVTWIVDLSCIYEALMIKLLILSKKCNNGWFIMM